MCRANLDVKLDKSSNLFRRLNIKSHKKNRNKSQKIQSTTNTIIQNIIFTSFIALAGGVLLLGNVKRNIQNTLPIIQNTKRSLDYIWMPL